MILWNTMWDRPANAKEVSMCLQCGALFIRRGAGNVGAVYLRFRQRFLDNLGICKYFELRPETEKGA